MSTPRALLAACCAALAAASPLAAAPRRPDDRLKADVLVVVAHSDDTVLVAPWLARAAWDQGKRIAVVHLTDSAAGRNRFGPEHGTSLGLVREAEGRRALARLGVENVWFLSHRDTPGQGVLLSLASWGHGSALEETVRLIRLTRPDVVLTWLPSTVIGQNHGDHQAAGVIATEAFDLAESPVAFPGQLASPAGSSPASRALEGLAPWQARKLYYFTDAFDTEPFAGSGPAYPASEVSPSRRLRYDAAAAEQLSFYRSQVDGYPFWPPLERGDFLEGAKLLTEKDGQGIHDPLRLVLGKALVPCAVGGDVFENASAAPSRPGPSPEGDREFPPIELGGAFGFFRAFGREHGLRTGPSSPAAIAVRPGATFSVPVVARNLGTVAREIATVAVLPADWVEAPRVPAGPLGPGESRVDGVSLQVPDRPSGAPADVVFRAEAAGRVLGEVVLRVAVRPDATAW